MLHMDCTQIKSPINAFEMQSIGSTSTVWAVLNMKPINKNELVFSNYTFALFFGVLLLGKQNWTRYYSDCHWAPETQCRPTLAARTFMEKQARALNVEQNWHKQRFLPILGRFLSAVPWNAITGSQYTCASLRRTEDQYLSRIPFQHSLKRIAKRSFRIFSICHNTSSKNKRRNIPILTALVSGQGSLLKFPHFIF